jgi:hypothetical protein
MAGPQGRSEGSEPAPRENTHSELSGSAGDVVQARVTGGVHFHRAGRVAGPVPRQLPGDVWGFVNRVVELERLDQVLANEGGAPNVVAVTVIAGTAGVGKTSLALHWAHRIRDRFPDGQLNVNLRGYDPGAPVTPEYALDLFLRAFDVAASAIPVDIHAKAALPFLGRGPTHIDPAGQRRHRRASTPVAAGHRQLPGSGDQPQPPARTGDTRWGEAGVRGNTLGGGGHHAAAQGHSGYRCEDDSEELAELARPCARLPLALRIAAERAASRPRMPLSELIRDLRDESALWDALSAEDNPEADAVRTVFAWSYRALPSGAARLFRLLGLHPSPEFCSAAAAALAGAATGRVRCWVLSLGCGVLGGVCAHQRRGVPGVGQAWVAAAVHPFAAGVGRHDGVRCAGVDGVNQEATTPRVGVMNRTTSRRPATGAAHTAAAPVWGLRSHARTW